MEEECVIGIRVEDGIQGRGGIERSLSSRLKGGVCITQKPVMTRQ